jgi:hypothetical protein
LEQVPGLRRSDYRCNGSGMMKSIDRAAYHADSAV